MSVAYSSSEGAAFVCAVYVCGCGRTATRYGRAVAEPPPGWVALDDEGAPAHACPVCAPRTSSTARSETLPKP